MFSIGDQVVHPMHGAGVIDDIVREKVTGITQDYYVFKMPMGGLVLKIPIANSQAVGLRSIMTPEETERLFGTIPSMNVEVNANWNKRYQENMLRLKSGDPYEVAQVVKALMHREHRRGLSTGERKMLHNAKQIMISEIVLTEQVPYQDAESRLNRAMMCVPAGQG